MADEQHAAPLTAAELAAMTPGKWAQRIVDEVAAERDALQSTVDALTAERDAYRAIVAAVATEVDDSQDWTCTRCVSSGHNIGGTRFELVHQPNCIIVRARTLLGITPPQE